VDTALPRVYPGGKAAGAWR